MCSFCDKWLTNLKYKITQTQGTDNKKTTHTYQPRWWKWWRRCTEIISKKERKKINSFNLLVSLLLSVFILNSGFSAILNCAFGSFLLGESLSVSEFTLSPSISIDLLNLKFLADYTCTRTFITLSSVPAAKMKIIVSHSFDIFRRLKNSPPCPACIQNIIHTKNETKQQQKNSTENRMKTKCKQKTHKQRTKQYYPDINTFSNKLCS